MVLKLKVWIADFSFQGEMNAFFARYRAVYSIYIVKTKLYTVEKGAYIVKERVSSWKTALQ